MAFNAGSVFATLGGRFEPAGFMRFGVAMRGAQSQMEASEKRMTTSAQRTSASLHAIGHAAKVGAGAGILGLGAVIAGSVKKAADFEQQLSSLGAVSNATGKQMAAMRKQAMAAGAATKFSALDAAKAQTELAKGGLSVQKILSGGLKGALALAAAGEMDLADAAATTANALNLFKLNGSQATHVADAMATAANATTADVGDFALALTQGGAAAKAAGLSFDQTIVALEALASSGVKGSDAGTSLKAALTQLASPTKRAQATMKDLGLEFFKANGTMKSMPQVAAMLSDKMGGLTKQQRLHAATTLVGTDGMRALLALYDTGAGTLTKFGDGLAKQGTAADVAAKKQDNLKGRLENLKGSLETAGIALGTKLLPMFEKLATKGTEWINGLVASGKIDQFAAGVEQAFRTIGEVLSDVAHFGAPIVSMFADIVGALGGLSATNIEAIAAGFAAFKIAGVVAPLVLTLAHALEGLFLAARAGALTQVFSTLAAGVNPVTAIATAAGLLASAFVLLGGSEKSEAEAARDAASAKRDETEALNAALDATLAAADATFGARHADQELAKAKRDLAEAADKHGKNSKQYRDALEAEREAALHSTAAHKRLGDAKRNSAEQSRKAREAAKKDVEAAKKEIEAVDFWKSGGAEKLAAGVRKYTEAQARAADITAVASLRHLQLQRLLAGGDLITTKNARAVSHLAQVYDTLPKKVQTRIDALPQSALANIGKVIGQLRTVAQKRTVAKILADANSATAIVLAFKALVAGVPARKVARIVASTSGAAEVNALRSAIAGVNSKDVYVRTHFEQIGSGPNRASRNARGTKTTGPQLAMIGEGRDPVEWVIPRDPQYRARAVNLLMDAAKSLLPGYAKGTKFGGVPITKPKNIKQALHLPVPARIAEGGVDFTAVSQDHTRIHGDYASAVKERKQAHDKWQAAQHRLNRIPANSQGHNYDRSRSNARDAVKTALKELSAAKAKEARLKPMATYIDRLFKAARATDSKAKGFQSQMNIFRDLMSDADRKGDQGAYTAARTNRRRATSGLIVLLQRALSLAKPGSAYARQLREQLVSLGGQAALSGVAPTDTNLGDFGGELGDPALSGAESGGGAPETFTDAEKARLSEINRDVALAALTEGLGDDTTAAGSLVSFLTSALSSAQSGGRGNDAITDIADQLKTARENLSSLTGGGGGNDNPDLQAQLEQEKQRSAALAEGNRTQSALLGALTSSNDVGIGLGNQQSFYISTLHPGDPATLRAIGDAAVSGIGLQPIKTSPRQTLGV